MEQLDFDKCVFDLKGNGSVTADTFNGLDNLKDVTFQEAKDRGFHQSEDNDEDISNFGDYTANLHSEVSELWEAYRKRKLFSPCDKANEMQSHNLPALTCAEEEIADILIRALDTAARLKINVAKAVYYKMLFNRTRSFRHGNKLA